MGEDKRDNTLAIVAIVGLLALLGALAFMFMAKDRGGQVSVSPAGGGFTIVERNF